MSQLCNVAYVALAEGMDSDQLAELEATLVGKPKPLPRSRGTDSLMAMMGGARG